MLHVYWNIPAGRIPAAGEKTVRVYLLPDEQAPVSEARKWFDVPVQGLRSQRYLDVEHDNAPYAAQFGVADRGVFLPLATSNAVRTPPAARTGPADIPEADRRTAERLRDRVAPAPAGIVPAIVPTRAAVFAQVPRPALLLDEEYIDALVRHRMGISHDPLVPAHAARPRDARPPASPGGVSSQSFLNRTRAATLRAELVFEGRVAPGMRLLLAGTDVPVSQDGSFSVRRPLAVDESLWRLLSGIVTPARHEVSAAAQTGAVVADRGERIQLELHAAVVLSGVNPDPALRELFGHDLTVRPDGSFRLTYILPRGACVVPELVAVARAPEGAS